MTSLTPVMPADDSGGEVEHAERFDSLDGIRMRAGWIVVVLIGLVALVIPLATRVARHPPASRGDDVRAESELSQAATDALATSLRRSGVDPVVRSASIELNGRALSVSTSTDSITEREGKVFAALDFRAAVDGRTLPALHTGSIGIGTSKETAVQTAIDEWVAQYGHITAAAVWWPELADGGVSPLGSTLSVGTLLVLPGPTGIRGEAPAELRGVDSLHHGLLAQVAPLMERQVSLGSDRLHTLTIMLAFDEGAPVQGECRVDAEVSPELLGLAQRYPWPTFTGHFMLKQYYVFWAGTPRPPR